MAAGLAATLTAALPVSATVGGPTVVTEVRHDARAGRVYCQVESWSGADLLPTVISFGVDDPAGTPARVEFDGDPGGGQSRAGEWREFRARLAGLPPLAGCADFDLVLHVRTTATELLTTPFGDRIPQASRQVELGSPGQSVALNLRTVSPGTVGVVAVYAVPGSERLLVIVRSRSDPFEGGYDVDTPVLLAARPAGGAP